MEIKREKREKNRLLSNVICKLNRWRNLYFSYNIHLDDAAILVGLSRKTLDDY